MRHARQFMQIISKINVNKYFAQPISNINNYEGQPFGVQK